MSWEYADGVPQCTNCVLFMHGGRQIKANVRIKKLMDADTAIAAISAGKAAWVKPEEADKVAAWLYART